MLTKYIEKAMQNAKYEILSDTGQYYGEIPICRGVFACAETLERCRNLLAEILEDWIFFRIYNHLNLPKIDGIKLTIKKSAWNALRKTFKKEYLKPSLPESGRPYLNRWNQ